jgi:predicted PurR-regulated permease PerM
VTDIAAGELPEGREPNADPLTEDAPHISLRMGDGRSLPRWFWRAVVAVAVAVAVFQFGRSILIQLQGFLLIVAISLFLSFAVEPAVNYLADRGWKRSVATLFCFFVLFVVGGIFLFVMGDLVVTQVQDLVENAPDYLEQSTDWVNDTFDTDITTDDITTQIESYQDDLTDVATNLGGRVLSVTGTLVGLIFQAFTVGLFSYYMTSQGPQLRRNVCSILPQRNQRTVLLLWELAIQKTGGWIYSRLLLAALSSACTWLFLSIVGVPSPLALALWVGLISQFIPAIGTYLAGALPVLIALLNDPIDAVWVLGFILVYQQIENYVFAPKITAQTMDLHPAVAFGAAIVGGTLLGPMGAVMALPAAGVIQAFVSTILERHEVVDSHLTELEQIREEAGDRGVRSAMRRMLRGGRGDAERGVERMEAEHESLDPDDPNPAADDTSRGRPEQP